MIAIIDTNHAFHKSFSIYRTMYGDEEIDLEKLIRKVAIDISSSINKVRNLTDVYFTWDSSSWRKEFYPGYKASRSEREEGFFDILDLFRDLTSQNYKSLHIEGAECDDLIALLTYSLDNKKKLILSADKDLHQLINEHTFVWNNLIRKSKVYTLPDDQKIYIDGDYVKQYVDPFLEIFTKVFIGCPMDEVPKIVKRGVGEKAIEKVYLKLENPFNFNKGSELDKYVESLYSGSIDDFYKDVQRNSRLVDLKITNIPKKIVDTFLKKIDDFEFGKFETVEVTPAKLLENSGMWKEI